MWFLKENTSNNIWEVLEDGSTIATVMQTKEEFKSKLTASVIANSLNLYEFCRELSELEDDNTSNVSLIKQRAKGLIASIEDVSNIQYSQRNTTPVAFVNPKTKSLMYSLSAKFKDFICFSEVKNGLGFLTLNIYSEDTSFIEDFNSLRFHIFSRHTADAIINSLSLKYRYLKDFLYDYENSDYSNLKKYINDMINDMYSEEYTKVMTLKEYISQYPLQSSSDSVALPNNNISHLADSGFSIHSLIEFNIDDVMLNGMLFYKKDEKKYYIYNVFTEEFFLSPIVDDDKILENIQIRFADFIA